MTSAIQRERFELTGSGSRPIRGEARVVPGASHGIVLVHGFKGFYRGNFFPLVAETLAGAGFNVVSFNMAGSGVGADLETFTEPAAFEGNSYGRELYDLTLVVREATARGWIGERWGLFGHSRGGGIAVLHAARDPRVGALATWASISTVRRWSDQQLAAWRERGHIDIENTRTKQVFRLGTRVLDEIERHADGRLDILRAAAEVRCPWLIVHGDRDETVRVEEGERLAAAARDAELVRIPGADHAFNVSHGFTTASPELRTALARTTEFLVAQLATP